MLENKTSVIDDRGYNQGFKETYASVIRMGRRADWIISKMNVDVRKKVLEIGCGTGFLSYNIAQKTGMHIKATDLCLPFIEQAKREYVLPNLVYEVLDFNQASAVLREKFDYIIGNGILHHLYYHLETALINFKIFLRDEGKIIFMEPNIYNPYVGTIFKIKAFRKWARLEPDEMAFSKRFIAKMLTKAGFKKPEIVYKDFLLPGIPGLLVKPSIIVGNLLEKTPVKIISQSLLISATL